MVNCIRGHVIMHVIFVLFFPQFCIREDSQVE